MKSTSRLSLLVVAVLLAPFVSAAEAAEPVRGIQPATPEAAEGAGSGFPGPAIEILGFGGILLGDPCDTTGGLANVTVQVSVTGYEAADSDCYQASIGGVGVVSQPFCETPGPVPDGVLPYGIVLEAPYAVAPGTPVTAEISTFEDGALGQGRLNHVSTIVFACDTGAVISLTNRNFSSAQAIPALGPLGWVLLASALAGLSLVVLRRRARTAA